MSTGDGVDTWEVLKQFGFRWDVKKDGSSPSGPSDAYSGLYYDLGSVELRATCQINLRFAEIVHVTGKWRTPRPLWEVRFQLPRRLDSREQCAALIAHYVDMQASDTRRFIAETPAPWLVMGRENQHLLPWAEQVRAFEDRASCIVERAHIKPVFRRLEGYVATVSDDVRVTFSFDGALFGIEFASSLLVVSGRGRRWPKRYTIASRTLRNLPRRLRPSIEVQVWDSALWINRWRYPGVETIEGETTLTPTFI